MNIKEGKLFTVQDLQNAINELADQANMFLARGNKAERLGGHIKISSKPGVLEVSLENINIIIDQGNEDGKSSPNTLTIDLRDKNIAVSFTNVNIRQQDNNHKKLQAFNFDILRCIAYKMEGCNFSETDINVSLSLSYRELYKEGVVEPNDQIYFETNKFGKLKITYAELALQKHGWTTMIIDNTIEKDLIIQHHSNKIKQFFLSIIGNTINNSFVLDLYNGDKKNNDGYSLELAGGNKIKIIEIKRAFPNISEWGLGESIGENILRDTDKVDLSLFPQNMRADIKGRESRRSIRSLISLNKFVLTNLKRLTVERGDQLQEKAINYNIAKCDELLIRAGVGSWKEKMTVWAGRLLSKHGTSWSLPLICMIGGNVFFGTIIYGIVLLLHREIFNLVDAINVLLSLFNPLSTPLSIVERIDQNFSHRDIDITVASISLFVFIAKAFYAMCIYEFVRAARRFTLK